MFWHNKRCGSYQVSKLGKKSDSDKQQDIIYTLSLFILQQLRQSAEVEYED